MSLNPTDRDSEMSLMKRLNERVTALERANQSSLHAVINTTLFKIEQTASIGSTTLVTSPVEGFYRIHVYHVCTSAGAAGTLATTIAWTDEAAARTGKPASDISLTGTNNAGGTFIIQSRRGTTIGYSTTVSGASGSPEYAVFISLEQLR